MKRQKIERKGDRSRKMVKGIPLCLPNNFTWDPATGKIQKTSEERSSLRVVPTAVKTLKEIKGPVCVVSIAGPCREGKSYIIGEVFGGMDVFSIGHKMDPETVGLWMWIVPQKYKDSQGRDFTVILLDSEGISSLETESEDDYQVFTLNVLLASILIYNSKNVPKRNDLKDLSFISKLSQRIRIRSKGNSDDRDLFRNTFPFFVWLLRDVSMELPDDCENLDQYFRTRVFKVLTSKEAENQNRIAQSILEFFSGWQFFALPSPTSDPNVMKNMATERDKLNPEFLKGVKHFEASLKSKLTPKRSINQGEYVTGEALAALLQTYTDAINDPDLMPTVESAWETYVKQKCSEATEKALEIYDQIMEPLSSRLPCDNEDILTSHREAQGKSIEAFEKETAELISAMIEKVRGQLTKSVDEKLSSWREKNHSLTKRFSEEILFELKAKHLDPVLKRVRGRDGAKVNDSEIMNGRSMIKTEFDSKVVGAKDVKADVFRKFDQTLQEEIKNHKEILKNLKDYHKDLANAKIANANKEREITRMQEEQEQLRQENLAFKNKIQVLREQMSNELQTQREKMTKDHKENIAKMEAKHKREVKQLSEERDGFRKQLEEKPNWFQRFMSNVHTDFRINLSN